MIKELYKTNNDILFRKEYKISTDKPDEVVAFIERMHPECKGIVFYNAEEKMLDSKSKTHFFHYDYFHGVVEVRIKHKFKIT